MNTKTFSKEDAVRIAAEVATKNAAKIGAESGIARYESERAKQRKKRTDRRLRDTRRLLTHYREIKLHAENAIASLAEITDEDYDFFQRIMESDRGIDVQAIVTSKIRSSIMLAHIDAMLSKYGEISLASKRQEDARRYRILEAMCIKEPAETVAEIAERECVHERTVYKDLDVAYSKMSALLFGVQWIERGDE